MYKLISRGMFFSILLVFGKVGAIGNNEFSDLLEVVRTGIPVRFTLPEFTGASLDSARKVLGAVGTVASENTDAITQKAGEVIVKIGESVGKSNVAAFLPFRREILKLVVGIGLVTVVAPLIKTIATKYIAKYLFEPSLIERRSSRMKRLINKIKGHKPLALNEHMVVSKQQADDFAHIVESTKNVIRNSGTFDNICLHGLPGTGKSCFAEFVAEHCNMDYAIVPAANISQFLADGTIVAQLNELFAFAESSSRGTVLFFDEAEVFLGKRGSLSAAAQNALSIFLAKTGTPSSKVMIICATNRPEVLDDAVKNRFGMKIEFALPDLAARKAQLAFHVNKVFGAQKGVIVSYSCLKNDFIVGQLAQALDGFTGRSIQQVVNQIRQKALAANITDISQDFALNVVNSFVKSNK